MVEVSLLNHCPFPLNGKTIRSFSISVQIHQILNLSCGVISDPELLFPTKKGLLQNLKEQNNIDVYRIRRHGQ